MPDNNTSPANYFDKSKSIYLEFYRGIAALGVAVSHYLAAKGSLDSEYAAVIFVEMFFPLSGFILATQVIRVFNRPSSLPIFLLRRWFRTIPLYMLGLFGMAAVTFNFYSQQFTQYLFFYHFLSENYTVNNFYPISWSLAAEEFYYIILPLFVLLLPRLELLNKVVVFLLIGLMVKIGMTFVYPDSFIRIATIARTDSIGIGFLCYLLMDRIRLYHLILLGFLAMSAAAAHYVQHSSVTVLPYMYATNSFFGVACALLYRSERARPCRNQPFRALSTLLGSASYAIYVLHLIVLTIAVKAGIGLWTYLALVLALSHATHEYLEQPIMRLRPNYRETAKVSA